MRLILRRYALLCVLPLILTCLPGCHVGEAVEEINRVDPATGKSVGQEIAEKAVKAATDPYNYEAWIALGTAVVALAGIAINGRKSTTNHTDTQEAVADLAKAIATVPGAAQSPPVKPA